MIRLITCAPLVEHREDLLAVAEQLGDVLVAAATVLVTASALANSSRSCSSREATVCESRLRPTRVPCTSGALVSRILGDGVEGPRHLAVSMSWVSRVSRWNAGTTLSGVVVRERGIVVPESRRPEPERRHAEVVLTQQRLHLDRRGGRAAEADLVDVEGDQHLVLVDPDVADQAHLEAGDADLLAHLEAAGVGEGCVVLAAGEEGQPARRCRASSSSTSISTSPCRASRAGRRRPNSTRFIGRSPSRTRCPARWRRGWVSAARRCCRAAGRSSRCRRGRS